MAQSNVIDIRTRRGRPTKLTDEIKEKAYDYIEGAWETKAKQNHPSVVGFATWIKVSRKTIYNWAESDEDFLHILGEINSLQEFTVLDRSLVGDYVAPLAKLVLGKHDYHDKAQTDHISSDGSFTVSWEK